MILLGLAFLIGIVSGLRTFTSIAAVCWGARWGLLSMADTKLAFIGYPWTPYVATVLALGELIADKLPCTPSRTRLMPFLARVASGSFCGACMGAAATPLHSASLLLIGLVGGAAGSVAGTLGGAGMRSVLAMTFGKDFPAALLEDVIVIGLAVVAVIARGRM